MKIIRFKKLKFLPASHEDPKNPGVLKKVLFVKDDLIKGRVQMINWAHLPKGKSFRAHYHEDMEEVFIITSGKAEIIIDKEKNILSKGDAVIVPVKAVHKMVNLGKSPVVYFAMGITTQKGGKSIVVEKQLP